MLVPASGISMGLRSDTRMRAGLTVMDTVSSDEDVDSANHPPLSRHGDISEITRFFFSGGPSASRRPSELSTYGTRDCMLNDAIGNVEDGFILTEHAYVSRSSSRSGGRRGVQESNVRRSSVNAIGNRATSSIFEELHNMCCQSSFPATSRWAKKGDTTRSEPTDPEQLGRNVGPKSTEKFLDCEFEMPSRTFIEFLRLRVSPLWAEMVQKVVDELSRTAGVDRGTRIADAGAGLLGASTTSIPDQIDTNMDLGSVRDSTRGDKAPSGMSGISPDILRVLDLLRAGARVRVVERKTPGMPSTQPSTGPSRAV